ncbi:MAG: DNA mismatch repair protein MutS [Anaerolineae bacterium]|nr:DNA mismatch repair protein MutS [Anaerolineae bacterium]
MTTPMRRQYLDLKRQHPDAILFFRLGDFYETFDADAEVVARVCGITLTSRPVGKDTRVPLAGVPYHSAEGYIARLLQAGYRVAVAEQSPDDDEGSLMQRQVVRVVTPGTITEEGMLSPQSNNYLAALVREGGHLGLAYADISTGEFCVEELPSGDEPALRDALARVQPAECVLLQDDSPSWAVIQSMSIPATRRESWCISHEHAVELIFSHFGATTLVPFALEDRPAATRAVGLCLLYLAETQPAASRTLAALRMVTRTEHLQLDATAQRTLELTETARSGVAGGSLLKVLDQTATPMGARLLRRRLLQPLARAEEIERRLDGVDCFFGQDTARSRVREILRQVPDLERLGARLSQGSVTPRSALSIAAACRRVTSLIRVLATADLSLKGEADEAARALDDCADVAEAIEAAVAPDAPATLNSPGIIRPGYSAELDRIVERATGARRLLAELEERERQRTGLKALRVGHNNVFGYYLEVPRAQAARVPPDYVRKQTLVSAERYFTEELKTLEADVYGAQERRLALERELWDDLARRLAAHAARLLATSRALAVLDVLTTLAEVARVYGYCRPEVNNSDRIEIREGRHPVVERSLTFHRRSFVPNDTELSNSEEAILILTGPNMAGKSTYLRQVALIVLMAQAGSFVPAAEARIGLVDRIFTRIGAQDELAAGQSTFMVEMIEVASILRQATPRSLVILDEVGRGTSTYDGMAIARAVVEHLHNSPGLGCRTLFATHYHELTDLEQYLPRVRNYNVAVAEESDRVVFLHRIVRGGADRSYGIHVARLAGVPMPVLERAAEVLGVLEAQTQQPTAPPLLTPSARQLGLFSSAADSLVRELAQLPVEAMTPIEALNHLDILRKQARATTSQAGQKRR